MGGGMDTPLLNNHNDTTVKTCVQDNSIPSDISIEYIRRESVCGRCSCAGL